MADPHDNYSTEPQLGPATPDRLAGAEGHDHHAHLFKIYMVVAATSAPSKTGLRCKPSMPCTSCAMTCWP